MILGHIGLYLKQQMNKVAVILQRHFHTFLLEIIFGILIPILLKFVSRSPIDNISTVAWWLKWSFGAKPLTEPMMTQFGTHDPWY